MQKTQFRNYCGLPKVMKAFLKSDIEPTYENYREYTKDKKQNYNEMTFNEFKKEIRSRYKLKSKINRYEDYSNENIIEAMEKVAQLYGKKFTRKQYRGYTKGTDYPSCITVIRRFGGFNKAKEVVFGKESANRWGRTIKINKHLLTGIDKRLLNTRVKLYDGLDTEAMVKNLRNYQQDNEFANFCLDCTEINGCHQNKHRCEYWKEEDYG